MKKRNIALMIVLYIVTFGIYGIYWSCSFQNQLKKKTGEGFGGGMHLLITIVTFGIYTIVWSYKVGGRLQKAGSPKNNELLYLILALTVGFVNPFLMQAEANNLPD